MAKKRFVSYRLDLDLYDQIAKHAEQNNMSKTEVVQQAIRMYLNDGYKEDTTATHSEIIEILKMQILDLQRDKDFLQDHIRIMEISSRGILKKFKKYLLKQ